MSYQFTAGRFKAFASDNSPLVSGRLYTYASGTTTQKNAYTDATLGTVCTYTSDGVGGLYIALDAKGEAQLWLGSGAYTFKLTDSLGATIWTVDGVLSPSDYTDTVKADLLDKTNASKGAGMVGFSYSQNYVAGTIGAIIKDVCVNVKMFPWLAKGDGATDDTAAIQAAIDAMNAAGGGTVLIPAGTFKCTSSLQMKAKVCIKGLGVAASILSWATTGDGIAATYPINSSTAAWNMVKDVQLYCSNASNTGGGYVDVGGTYVYLENVYCNGFKYGVIFDQTELGDINLCNFANQTKAGVWLVNGSAHTPGALGVFTNRIAIRACQFNEGATVYGVIDDGGYSHTIDGNNFNAGYQGIRSAGTQGLTISNNYLEAQANECIGFYSTTEGGIGAGANTATNVIGNFFVPISTKPSINANSLGKLVLIGNDFGASTSVPQITVGSIADVFESGNRNASSQPLFSASPSWQFRTNDTGTFTPVVAFGGASVGITYATQTGKYTRVGNVVSFAINITLTSKGTSTGSLQISGLPYTSIALNQIISAPYMNNVLGGITTAASNIAASGTTITFFNAAINASDVLKDTNVSNNTTINLAGSYLVA